MKIPKHTVRKLRGEKTPIRNNSNIPDKKYISSIIDKYFQDNLFRCP